MTRVLGFLFSLSLSHLWAGELLDLLFEAVDLLDEVVPPGL